VTVKFQVGDQVLVLSGPFSGFEGEVLALPSLRNFYSYSIMIQGRTVRGLKANQLGHVARTETYIPPRQEEEADVSPLLQAVAVGAAIDLNREELLSTPETFQGEGGQFGGGGASESYDAPEAQSFESADSSPDCGDSSSSDSGSCGSDFGGSDFGGGGSDF
jgi:ribosomal protein L24